MDNLHPTTTECKQTRYCFIVSDMAYTIDSFRWVNLDWIDAIERCGGLEFINKSESRSLRTAINTFYAIKVLEVEVIECFLCCRSSKWCQNEYCCNVSNNHLIKERSERMLPSFKYYFKEVEAHVKDIELLSQ